MSETLQNTSVPKSDRSGDQSIILKTYGVAALFVALFVLLLVFGGKITPSLGEAPWALLVAVMLTLPLIGPWLTKNLLPRLHSIKISEIEIAFKEAEARAQPLTAAAQAIAASMSDNPVMTEYAGRMTSLSSSIIDAIKAVQASKHEVLAVDFATLWLVPNLYFLSLMAAQKTRVRQIAFMDSRIEPDRFVCFSSPDAILIALETHFPSLREAATLAQFEQNRSDVGQAAGMNFFGSLQQVYNKTPAGATERAVRVTPESLLWLLGSEAHRETVQWASPPKEKQYKAVLESGSEFVAALEGNQLLFLVSRERVALAVARAVQDAN